MCGFVGVRLLAGVFHVGLEAMVARGGGHGFLFGGKGYLEPGVGLKPHESGALELRFSLGASAGYGGKGGAVGREEAATAGSTWLPRGWGRGGGVGTTSGAPWCLVTPDPRILGPHEAVGREMLGEVASRAKILEVFVPC